MRKSTFFWRELNAVAPSFVRVCAGVFVMIGARAVLNETAIKKAMLFQLGGYVVDNRGNPDASSDPSDEELAVYDLVAQDWARQELEELDKTFNSVRRTFFLTLLVLGSTLVAQPWYSLAFIGMPILVAGGMLAVLEFCPKTGDSLSSLISRFASRHEK